ncbi:hypothetical protein EMIT043CA1_20365 [Pseudomonas brassicacearum]
MWEQGLPAMNDDAVQKKLRRLHREQALLTQHTQANTPACQLLELETSRLFPAGARTRHE